MHPAHRKEIFYRKNYFEPLGFRLISNFDKQVLTIRSLNFAQVSDRSLDHFIVKVKDFLSTTYATSDTSVHEIWIPFVVEGGGHAATLLLWEGVVMIHHHSTVGVAAWPPPFVVGGDGQFGFSFFLTHCRWGFVFTMWMTGHLM